MTIDGAPLPTQAAHARLVRRGVLADAREAHESYKRHLAMCAFACSRGGLCPVGEAALRAADIESGRRHGWEEGR